MVCQFLLDNQVNQVYIYPPPWTSLPPHSRPTRSSQSTEPSSLGCTAGSTSCLLYTWQCVHVDPNLPAHHTHPSPCPRLLSTSASLILPCKYVHLHHCSRFYTYTLIYDICFPFHFQIQSCFTSWLLSLVLWTLSKLLASFGQQAAQCVSTGHLPGASHSFLDGPWPIFWKGQGLPHSVHADDYSIVYVYHIFLTHSPVSGHLGCFHVLAVVDSAAVNIGIHVSFWIMVFSGYMPSRGISRS